MKNPYALDVKNGSMMIVTDLWQTNRRKIACPFSSPVHYCSPQYGKLHMVCPVLAMRSTSRSPMKDQVEDLYVQMMERSSQA